ncbi:MULTISPECIES: SRPBCC family protein [unclassified Streptomyces]|uniref:SRPBCC family protein n=1 Tax=unclassified Streptomyces TaxID=2593676 RepID=UPI0035DFA786
MGMYTKSITVEVPPERLFRYLADVKNLPAYLPRLTAAHPQGGDRVTVSAHIDPPDGPEQDVTSDAFIRVTEEGKSLEWSSPGPNDYHGRLHITAGDAESSELTVELHTERTEGKPVEDGLTEALRGIRNAVEQAEH